MSKTPPPKRRVRRDHTCISLGLKGTNNSHMCDNCKEFQMRRDGVSGRRPGKNAKSVKYLGLLKIG